MADSTRYARFLDSRVPQNELILGRAYLNHARNGGVGVAVLDELGSHGYQLRRWKFVDRFLL